MSLPFTNAIYADGDENLSSFSYETYGNCNVMVYDTERVTIDIAREIADFKSRQDDNGAFFVMDMAHVCNLMNVFRMALPRVHPFHSIRCNSDPIFLRLLASQSDMGFLCADASEFLEARNHVDNDRILYANPLWTRNNVRRAEQIGSQYLVCDSEDDFLRVKSFHENARVILRVSMENDQNGLYSGCELNNAPYLIGKALSMSLNLIGIGLSFNLASPSLMSVTSAIAHSRHLFDYARDFGLQFDVLDIGDAFGEIESRESSSFAQLCFLIRCCLSVYFPPKFFCNLHVIAELGSFFASGAFMLVTNVIGRNPANTYFVSDAADFKDEIGFVYRTNDGCRKSFGFMLTEHREPHCEPLHECDWTNNYFATILGTTIKDDVLLSITRLPYLKVGDWLMWKNMGISFKEFRNNRCGDSPYPAVYYYLDKYRWRILQSAIISTTVQQDDIDSTTCAVKDVQPCYGP